MFSKLLLVCLVIGQTSSSAYDDAQNFRAEFFAAAKKLGKDVIPKYFHKDFVYYENDTKTDPAKFIAELRADPDEVLFNFSQYAYYSKRFLNVETFTTQTKFIRGIHLLRTAQGGYQFAYVKKRIYL